jgi:NAD(P)-dependent dehydrogenase (short-subunit alcohol dehydrogenase family)
MSELAGRVAIVTGGSSGIGRATVSRLAELGADVASFDIALPAPGARSALEVRCDVTDEAAVKAGVAQVAALLGPPTILVNNAGVNAYFDPVAMTSSDWDGFFALDLKAAWLVARSVLPHQRVAGRGAIVNVASIHATVTTPGRFPYAAAKSGMVGLTRSLALDVAADGITVNAVLPGLIDTPLARAGHVEDGGDPATFDDAARSIPVQRLGRPEDVADLVGFLAGDRASFITGAALPIDGGAGAAIGGV